MIAVILVAQTAASHVQSFPEQLNETLCQKKKKKPRETRRGEFSGSVLIKQVGGPKFILRLKTIPPHIWCRKMAIEKTTRNA